MKERKNIILAVVIVAALAAYNVPVSDDVMQLITSLLGI